MREMEAGGRSRAEAGGPGGESGGRGAIYNSVYYEPAYAAHDGLAWRIGGVGGEEGQGGGGTVGVGVLLVGGVYP